MLEKKLNDLKKWFNEKMQLIKLSFKFKTKRKRLICKMGDIYFAKIGINIGSEIDKHRPVLDFQGNDYFARNSDLVFVFPITTNMTKSKFKVNFQRNDLLAGHLRPGSVLIFQGRTISKVRLVNKMAVLSGEKLKDIKNEFDK
jgi:mRNA-degrading endonuclease toxin of MazEF toxin-antitoxin module